MTGVADAVYDHIVVGAGTLRTEGYRPARAPIVVVSRSADRGITEIARAGGQVEPGAGGDSQRRVVDR